MKNKAVLTWSGKCRVKGGRLQQNNDKVIAQVKEQGTVGIHDSKVEN